MKRALVLSGGGSKGQYHIGALRHLLGDLERPYHILSGTSVGALVAGFLAMYPVGAEKQSATELEHLFGRITDEHIWKHWTFFRRAAGFWKPSFLNSKPLQELVSKEIDCAKIRASKKELRVVATSLTSGQAHVFDQHQVPLDRAILASSAFPGMFLPVAMNGDLWTDGGVRNNTPLKSAIVAGADEVDVLVCAPADPTEGFSNRPKAFPTFLRAVDIMLDEATDADLRFAKLYNDLAGAPGYEDRRKVKLNIIRPDRELNEDPLTFNLGEAMLLREEGYRDAVAAMAGE